MLTVHMDDLDVSAGDRVLDLGCGEGRHLHGLCSIENIRLVGIDLCFNDLEKTRAGLVGIAGGQTKQELSLVQGDALRLPFANNAFDVVICSEVLEHLDDYEEAVLEIKRILKPGGALAISVPRMWPEKICWALSEAYHTAPGGHVRIFNAGRLRRRIEVEGFTFLHQHWAHALHTPFWWLKCLFWNRQDDVRLIALYHRLLVWDLMSKPMTTRIIERMANPVLGKSVVLYFRKRLPN